MPQKNDVENPVDPNNLAAVKAQEMLNRETGKDPYVNSGIDQLSAYGNDPANATSSNTDKVREQEEQPSLYKPSNTQKKPRGANLWIRKRAAMIGITTILGGAGLASTFFAGPALLLVQFKEVFTNYGSASSRAADTRNNESLYYRLKNVGSTENACRGSGAVSSVRCKRGSMTEKNVQTLKDKGFKVESKVVGGRHIVSTITDPDGTQMKGTRESIRTAMAKPSFASRMKSAINPKTLVHNGGRFSEKVLKPLGLDKSAVRVSGDTDEERKESLNKISGAADEDTREKAESKFKNQHEGKIKGVAKIGQGPVAVAGAGCSAYNMSRVTLTAIKLYNVARFASFAMLFLKAADQIKANGSVDPVTVALLGGVLTSYATSGPSKGLTATDSQGYKTAAYGGEGALKSFSKRFLLGGNEKLIDLDNSINGFENIVGAGNEKAGKTVLKNSCGRLADPVYGSAITAAVCAASGAGSGAVGTAVVPVLGTAVGAIAGTAACVVGGVAVGLFAGEVIGKIFEWALPKIIDALTDAPIDVNKIKGPEAGDAAAAGAGYLNERTNLSRGMQPGTQESVTDFNSGTQESADTDLAAEKYMAQNTPFDVYNEHSFFGSFVRNSGLINTSPLSPSFLGSLFSTATLSPITAAAGSMPVNITSKDLDHCPDQTLKDIGVDCDAVGGTQYVMNTSIGFEENLNFMIGTHIDEQGEPISQTYKDWVANCTEQRTDPIGMTSVGIEAELDDPGWKTGESCVFGGTGIDQNTRDNFSAYYFDSAAQEDEEYVPPVTNSAGSGLSGPGTSFRLSSYNIENIKSSQGESLNSKKPQYDTIMNNLRVRNIDLVGTQEMESDQEFNYFKNGLKDDYGIFPEEGSNTSRNSPHARSILYNKEKFSFVKAELLDFPRMDGTAKAPVVWLKDNDTQQGIIIMNTHNAAGDENGFNGNRYDGPKQRYDSAQIYINKIKELQSEELPIFFTGDFNEASTIKTSGNTTLNKDYSNLLFCMFAENKLMQDARTTSKNNKMRCPNDGGSGVDFIYASPGVDISNFTTISNSGSDHDAIFADIKVLSSGSAISSAAWPVDKKWWDSGRADFVDAHSAASGTYTNGIDSLAVDIGVPPDGSPVYAMYGGKVTRPDLGGHGLVITSQIQGGSLEIAYAHGPRENQNTEYATGDKIMEIGCLGNCDGGHVHIDMAFNGKGVCPQDVFIAMAKGQEPDFKTLTSRATAPCAGRS